MEYCVSLSVSYEVVCVVIIDDKGRAIDDFLVPTAPDIIDCVLRELDMHITQIGIEFGVVGQWLAQELQDRGWNAFCLEYANVGRQTIKNAPTRHSEPALLIKALIKVRKALLREMVSAYNSLFFTLKKVGKEFLIKKNPKIALSQVQERSRLLEQCLLELDHEGCFHVLERYADFDQAEEEVLEKILDIACEDEDVQRLVKIPGVSYIAALYFIIAMENIKRFSSGKEMVSYLGLVPGAKKKNSDPLATAFLMTAATGIMSSPERSALKMWGLSIAKKSGLKVAQRAVARKLAFIMYRILLTKEEYRQAV